MFAKVLGTLVPLAIFGLVIWYVFSAVTNSNDQNMQLLKGTGIGFAALFVGLLVLFAVSRRG